MKRILLNYPVFNLGGAEMSSLRLMSALADRGWMITFVVNTGGGVLESALDPRVRLVRLRPASFGDKFLQARGLKGRMQALPDLLAYAGARVVGWVRLIPFLFQRYEVAATLLHGTSTWFSRRVVRADVRIHFIRNDLAGADPTGRVTRAIKKAQPEIDHYICVSNVAYRSLVAAVPETNNKASVIYNILNPEQMRARIIGGDDPFPPRTGGALRVLTVCRLGEAAKGLSRMTRVCRRLADDGLDFQWFIVGDGQDRGLLEREIGNQGISERMILLGSMKNPFPAYANADVVAMLSNYEGLCGVVNEAKVAGCAVVATQVSGIDEQLVDGENGLVVENNEDAIVMAMRRVLTNTALRDQMTNNYLPSALLDDETKLDRLEQLLLGTGVK